MQEELFFLRSSEQYLAKELLLYKFGLEKSDKDLQKYPELEQYERHFGSFSGDTGVYIITDKKVAGAAWVRLLSNGFAFTEETTPELLFYIKPEFKDRGIESKLIEQLFIEATKIFTQISVSVEVDSTDLNLFKNHGFTIIENSEHLNVLKIASIKMIKDLDELKIQKEEKHLEEECFKKSFSHERDRF